MHNAPDRRPLRPGIPNQTKPNPPLTPLGRPPRPHHQYPPLDPHTTPAHGWVSKFEQAAPLGMQLCQSQSSQCTKIAGQANKRGSPPVGNCILEVLVLAAISPLQKYDEEFIYNCLSRSPLFSA